MFSDVINIWFQLPSEDDDAAKYKIGQQVKLNLPEEKALRLGAPATGIICGLQVQDEDSIEYQIQGFGPLLWETELEEINE